MAANSLTAVNLAGCMKTLAEVIEKIAKHFEIDTDCVKFQALGEFESFLSVRVSTKFLGQKRYSSEDFDVFCRANDLRGFTTLTPDGCYMVFNIFPDISQ